MPWIFRILPGQGIFHILTRGNNRQAVFLDEENALLDFDPLYQDIGCTDTERRKRYRNSITEEVLNLNARFLGKDSFIKEMEKNFEVKNLKGKRGRPKKIK